MHRLPFVFLLCLSLLSRPRLQAAETPSVTLSTLLEEMIDPAALARWPDPAYTSKVASSYDRQKRAPDQPGWFANHDYSQFVRTEQTNGRREQVMMDADGPGAIVRFWLTTAAPKAGTLRIYFDGSDEAVLVWHGYDLLANDLVIPLPLTPTHPGYSAVGGGVNLYLPLPYSKHCKVTWEEGPRTNTRYYQITYRTYSPATSVETYSRTAFDHAQPLLQRVASRLTTPAASSGHAHTLKCTVAAGQTVSLDLPAGPGAIRELSLELPTGASALSEQALRSLILQAAFDGETTIWCPVTDFFGSGVGINDVSNCYQTVSSKAGQLSCRWAMPYEKTGNIMLQNLGAVPVSVVLTATESPWKWDARSMHFYTQWHYESGLQGNPPRDWNFATIAGRGVWVGDTLAVFNPVQTWYGEGDEKIYVDGEIFPSDLGTGVEDYFGYSYAPKGILQTPFGGQVRIDESHSQGHNVDDRIRLLDGIAFTQKLRFDWELISWKPTLLTYAATAHWYAVPGATSNVAPQAVEAVLPVQSRADFR